MLCLVGVNDFGRNGMKDELYYGQLLTNFIPSSIPFLILCARDHTFNLRWNATFSPTPNFFSNLIIAILYSLKFFFKTFFLSLYISSMFYSFHSIPFSPTKHNIRKDENRFKKEAQKNLKTENI